MIDWPESPPGGDVATFAVEWGVRPLGRFLPGIRCAAAVRKPVS